MADQGSVPGMNQFPVGECWNIVEKILKQTSVDRLLLWGASGLGKTYMAGRCLQRPQERVIYITCTPEMPESRLWGRYKPEPTVNGMSLKWEYGHGAEAFRHSHKGYVTLVLNEILHAGPDAVSAFHPILDDIETAIVTLDNGEEISKTNRLRIIATMNGTPEELLPSLADRFPVSIEIDSVHPDALKALPEDIRTLAAKTALETDPDKHIGYRKWVDFAKIRREVNQETACKAIVGKRWLELHEILKAQGVKGIS